MHKEIEERVLEINTQEIIKKLESLGARKVGDWYQKRYVYDFKPKRENEWIRLRDTGEEVTLSVEDVKRIEKLLEVDTEKITALNCQGIYKRIYSIDIDKIKELKF